MKKEATRDNTVFVGMTKPLMNYVNAVIIQFQRMNHKKVIVSARGKSIGRAVDVAKIARNKFLKDKNIVVEDVKISSEEFEGKEGKMISVSAIDIVLVKGGGE